MPEVLTLRKPVTAVAVSIDLPASKSESNRALIIQALSEGAVEVQNISKAEDTEIMKRLLSTVKTYCMAFNDTGRIDRCLLDVGAAGTVMRFLSAYLCLQPGHFELTGSLRMQQRPVKLLVDSLRTLGAEITYKENEGYPPLYITGKELRGDQVTIQGDISSQYISALLMIAPKLATGLSIQITGRLTSAPYVMMTREMMHACGIASSWSRETNLLVVPRQNYRKGVLVIENDWSGASYWFSIVALSQEAKVILKGLKSQSLQGDREICSIMEHFAVSCKFTEEGLEIKKVPPGESDSHAPVIPLLDFSACPDLAQTVIACAAALNRPSSFTGLETLKIKETDRIKALDRELNKLGVKLTGKDGIYSLDLSEYTLPEKVQFSTYDDHRMAMALAPLSMVIPEVTIDDAGVVEKSYPSFWNDLQKSGFSVKSFDHAR